MKFEQKTVSTQLEILKRRLGGELFVPVTIADSEFASSDVVKAGNPIAADGTVVNDGTAIGILLNDVYKENPNGSLVKAFAVINEANANKNAGITIDSAVKSALSEVVFE